MLVLLNFYISGLSRLYYGYSQYYYNVNIGRKYHHTIYFATAYIISKDYANKIMEWLKTHDINGEDGCADVLLYIVLPHYNFNDIWAVKKTLVFQNDEGISDINSIVLRKYT